MSRKEKEKHQSISSKPYFCAVSILVVCIRNTQALYNFESSWRIKNQENQVIFRCLLRCFPLPIQLSTQLQTRWWERVNLQTHQPDIFCNGSKGRFIILNKQLFRLFIIHQFRHVNKFLFGFVFSPKAEDDFCLPHFFDTTTRQATLRYLILKLEFLSFKQKWNCEKMWSGYYLSLSCPEEIEERQEGRNYSASYWKKKLISLGQKFLLNIF